MAEQEQPQIKKGKLWVEEVRDKSGTSHWSALMLPLEGGAVLAVGDTKIQALKNYGKTYRAFRNGLKPEPSS